MLSLVNCDENDNSETFEKLLEKARNKQGKNTKKTPLKNDSELFDNTQPIEAGDRSRSISQIVRAYAAEYNNKVSFQSLYRKILFWLCFSLIIAFFLATLVVLFYAVRLSSNHMRVANLIGLITAFLSFVGSIIGLIMVITNYCFPSNYEKSVVELVGAVQQNDLAHYIEISRTKQKAKKNKPDYSENENNNQELTDEQ